MRTFLNHQGERHRGVEAKQLDCVITSPAYYQPTNLCERYLNHILSASADCGMIERWRAALVSPLSLALKQCGA
jgi:spore coat protein CotF